MSYFITTIKVVFIAIQVCLAVYFISDAFNDWEKYPTVTSVEFRNIENELFPAVTICYPNSWKWPGIINVLDKWNASISLYHLDGWNNHAWYLTVGDDRDNTKQDIAYNTQFFKIGDRRATAMEYDYMVNGRNYDFCRIVSELFKTPSEQLQGRFILNVIDQIAKGDFSDSKLEEVLMVFDLSRRFAEFKSLKFEDVKKDVCQLGYLDCEEKEGNSICPNNQSYPQDKVGYFYYNIHYFWVVNKLWNPHVLLHSLQNKAFVSKTKYSAADKYYDLYEKVTELSKGYPINAFSMWHYLRGVYVDPDDEIFKGLKSRDVPLSSFGLCLENDCGSVTESMSSMDEVEIKKYLQLIDQPKIHGGEEDFVLVPLCSFGKEQLRECKDFKKANVSSQDDTCYTYENPSKVGYKQAKFQFVLNMRENMPKDDPLSLKVLLHEVGTIPDVLEIDSASQTIYAENDFTKIGVTIDSNEITDSFKDMGFEKRQCYLAGEMKNYSRINCLTKHAVQTAWKTCQCTPWTMGDLINDTKTYCNVTGSICFRNSISKVQENIGEDTCPKMCSSKQYKMLTPDHVRFDPFKAGPDYLDFLINNPRNQLLEELHTPLPDDMGNLRNKQWYIKKNSEAFSIVQVYFQDPQMTVIEKDAKVTVPDMVSNIGGTIGIFLGLSFLSLLDLFIEFSSFIKKKYFNRI